MGRLEGGFVDGWFVHVALWSEVEVLLLPVGGGDEVCAEGECLHHRSSPAYQEEGSRADCFFACSWVVLLVRAGAMLIIVMNKGRAVPSVQRTGPAFRTPQSEVIEP